MSWEIKNRNATGAEYLILVFIIATGVYITLIPRLGYSFPIHLDEWFDIACANQIFKQGTVLNLVDPFSGGSPNLFQSAEVGFHLFLGIFSSISGLDWPVIFSYLPAFLFIFTILATYITARKLGFGVEAAFMVCLMPTTLGILGPAFLVPVTVGLLFIPLSLFVMFNYKGRWSPAVLAIFMAYLLASHAYTALALLIVSIPYLVISIKDNWKSGSLTALALGLPFLVSLPLAWHLVEPLLRELTLPHPFSPDINIPNVVRSLGYLVIALCLLGAVQLSYYREKRGLSLLLGFILLSIILVVYANLHYGIGGFYERGLVYMMMLASIIAGAGLALARNLSARAAGNIGRARLGEYAGPALALVLAVAVAVTVIPERQAASYYQMIDKTDYETFVWIKENTGGRYERALLDPWKGTAFTAITGMKVTRRITMATQETDRQILRFLNEGCNDTEYLRSKGVSLVYTRQECTNPDLVQISDYIYVLE